MVEPFTMAIGAGLSLLSSFGSAKSAKSQQRRQASMDAENRRYNQYVTDLANSHNERVGRELLETPAVRQAGVDVDRMMADADRAGFNPVTWLQAGALQSYGWSTETQPAEAFRMMLQTPALSTASQAVKIPNALEAVGDAGTVALNMYRQDAARQDSQDFQMSMLGMQLDAYNKRSGSGSSGSAAFGSIPRMTTSGGSKLFFGEPGLGQHSVEPAKSSYTNPHQGGVVDTTIADAQAFNQRYGDEGPVSWFYGLEVADRDLYKNYTGMTRDQFWKPVTDWWAGTGWNPSNPMPNYGQRNPGYNMPWLGSGM